MIDWLARTRNNTPGVLVVEAVGVRFFAPGTTERNAASSGHLPRGARRAPTL